MAEEEPPRTQEEEAEMMARLQEQIRRMSVSDHIAYMLESLAALATRKLGLGPETAEERDPVQARLAIDAFRALLQLIEDIRPQEEVRAHRAMLSQLQLAYVQVLDRGSAPPAQVEETPDAASDVGGEEGAAPAGADGAADADRAADAADAGDAEGA